MSNRLNLKRALKLKRELSTKVEGTKVSTTGKISVLIQANRDNPEAAIEALRAEMFGQVGNHASLSNALGYLRSAIIRANVEGGVEDLLSQIARMDRRIVILKTLVGARLTPPLEQIASEINLQSQTVSDTTSRTLSYSRPDREIEVELMTAERQEELRQALAQERADRERLEEQRIAKNLSIMIEIPDEMADLLRKNGLL